MAAGEVYTYHAGQKVELRKRADEFVVRALPNQAMDAGLPSAEQVSSASSRVRVNPSDLEPLMATSREIAPTHHAYEKVDTGEEFLITDRVYVRFKQALAPEAVGLFAGQYGLIQETRFSDKEYLFQLTDHTGMNPVKLVVKLQEQDERVEVAEHDLNYRAQRAQLPSDGLYLKQWHLHARHVDADFDPRATTQCEGAWEALGNRGSPEVVVGVTDDGCRLDHPDFDSSGKFAGWGYFQGTQLVRRGDPGAEPGRMYQSGADHGTACCGVVAAEVDGQLTVGAAPGCRLLPIKWESSGPSLFISDSKLRTALDYMADKVDVISNSWGVVPTNTFASYVTSRIRELAQSGGRRGKGIVFLWAAGNENCPIEHSANVDVPYSDGWALAPNGTWFWQGVRTARTFRNNLVGIPGLMHVAALASNAQRSHYSNYGTGISVCAPSSNSHAYYRMPVRGLSITTTSGESSLVDRDFGGTSSATPLVAGIAALVVSANADLTAEQVVALLKRTASKQLDPTPYPRTPAASFDPNPTWDVSPVAPFDKGDFKDIASADGTWSPWFGHGRVDAARAVAEARAAREGAVQTLRHTSNPERPIPDADVAGIEDVIEIAPSPTRIRDVAVTLDIAHTWIGDLRVALTTPDGTRIVLWNRQGSNANDIKQTFTAADVPALATLRDKPPSGRWTLSVQDAADLDVGILKSWALELTVTRGPFSATDASAVLIPDNQAGGVTRTLEVPEGTRLEEIAVSVDITHPWIGDLRVELIPPGGAPVVLHDRAGGSADNILRTWRSAESAALGALRGTEAGGRWRLRVADLAQRDVGKLNRWELTIG